MLINLERARRLIAEAGYDALVLASPLNVIYASDFASEYLLGRFEDWAAAVVLPADADRPPTLVLQEFDLPYLAENPSWIETIQLFGNPWSSVGAFMGATLERELSTALRRRLSELRDKLRASQQPNFLAALSKALGDGGLAHARLACDDMRLARRLEEEGFGGNRGIGDALQLMRRIRIVKTADEVEIMRRGAAINASALARVIAAGRAGVAEDDLIRHYRATLVEHDARWLGERGMMFGAGDASSFSLPASHERTLAPGQAAVLDCLGTYKTYHMDLARTAVVGDPTPEQALRYDAVVTALEAVEAKIMPGVHTEDLRRLTRDTIAGFGLRPELVSVTTHGLGLEVFEFPFEDSLVKGYPLEEGMVVNTEVFYRDPDLGSFHLEDSVLVHAHGCRLLHPVARTLVCFH